MSLIGCVGTRLSDAVVSAIAEAIKDDCPQRLEAILVTNVVVGDEINRKNLLHQAAWLGKWLILSITFIYNLNQLAKYFTFSFFFFFFNAVLYILSLHLQYCIWC